VLDRSLVLAAAIVALLVVLVLSAVSAESPMLHASPQGPVLRFVDDGSELRALSLSALRARCGEASVAVDDPYYERRMTFHAVPLRCVLEQGFSAEGAMLAGQDFSLVALDGYERPSGGAQLLEAGGYLAFGDASLTPVDREPRFEPIARRQLDPAPFYLVWSGVDQGDPHRTPWPYQLATIERVPFSRRHPHTLPTGAPEDGPAWRGFELFRSQCVMCHSVNGDGGTVGPELNVPKSIVEYRDREFLAAFIRDPESFRYGAMPSHRHLEPSQIEALLDYFDAMSQRKHDRRARQ